MGSIKALILLSMIFSFGHPEAQSHNDEKQLVRFREQSVKLTRSGKLRVDSLINTMQDGKLLIEGAAGHDYVDAQYSWARMDAVRAYIIDKGGDTARIIFRDGREGPSQSVSLSVTLKEDSGRSITPPPHPVLTDYPPRKWHKVWKKLR